MSPTTCAAGFPLLRRGAGDVMGSGVGPGVVVGSGVVVGVTGIGAGT